MTPSPAQTLLDLQTADVEIIRAEKRLEELPEKRAILEARAKIKETSALRDKVSMLERKLSAELKLRQDEITMLGTKIAAEQGKIMHTTDHRQIQALTREMDGLRRRVDKLEMESMQYMERIEKATSQVATVEAHLAKMVKAEADLVARFRSVGGALQEEIAAFKAERERLAHTVDAQLLASYEAARDSKGGGIGVGRLEGDACTACRMSLPATRVQVLRDGPDVGVCPQCRRLIVVRTGEAE